MSSPISSSTAVKQPSSDNSPPSELALREIPGGYGFPFFGPIKDRLDYYYSQGEVEFFRSRMKKFNSTVFRCNMPPGPFLARNPQVICLLDAISFEILFDNSKIEKKNVLDGTYMPSTAFTGGYRTCAYLDPSEPNHAVLKGFFLTQLAKLHSKFIPGFRQSISGLFTSLEQELSDKGKSNFNALNDIMSFDFVFRLFCDKNPSETPLGPTGGPKMITRNFTAVFFNSAGPILDEAEKIGIKRDEACHNLVFLAGFNAYGGMKALFPALIKWVATAGEDIHRRLAAEIRAVVKEEGGVSTAALEKMCLTKSVVYEALRIEPPVPYQYGKAKQDILIKNHDSNFLIKKDEMIFGYQPIATKDSKVFEDPENFVADRFLSEGEKLIKYVYWSNGRETDDPTVDNKQCPGKDLVVLLSRLMLVEFFLKYDTFSVEIGKLLLGSLVTFKSLTKAT
ncbi:Allene oxide synthase [Abeliophyllum distichum]|uniref:Allene oxide synthase n=1 Tax=Abeliophyllum distichum TaxID=126358 RepID=A0ABD1RQM9_9LAMI